MRAARLGAALHSPVGNVDGDRRRIAISHFTLAADLLELVAARDQILQQRSREAIFDLDALAVLEGIGGIAAGQKTRRFDRRLRAELAVDYAGNDVVDRDRY